MRTIKVPKKFTRKVIEFLSEKYADVTKLVWELECRTFAVFIHQEYVFRTRTYQTLTTILDCDDEYCTVTAVGSGGGGGMLNIDWGSQGAGEDTIIKNVKSLIRE